LSLRKKKKPDKSRGSRKRPHFSLLDLEPEVGTMDSVMGGYNNRSKGNCKLDLVRRELYDQRSGEGTKKRLLRRSKIQTQLDRACNE